MAPQTAKLGKSLSHVQTSAVGSVTLATERRLLFASEYLFKPKGLAYISKEFEDQLGSRKFSVKLKYDAQKYMFMITCAPGESRAIWKIFFTILTTLVNDECRKSALILREENKHESSVDEEEEEEDDEEEEEDDDDDDSEAFDEDLILRSDKIERLDVYKARQTTTGVPVQSSKHQFIHKYMWKDESLDLNDVFPDSILYELTDLTKCSFSKELGNHCIKIGSHTEVSLHAAISKLDNIKKYFRPLTQFTYHSFYTEADLNVEFALLRFSTVKNRYYRTTLIDDLDLDVQGSSIQYPDLLEKAVTVRCASYDRATATYRIIWKLKVAPAVKEKDKGSTLESHKTPKISSQGSVNGDTKSRNSNHLKSKKVSSTKSRKQNNTNRPGLAPPNNNLTISNWVQDVVESRPLVLQRNNDSPMTEWNQLPRRSKTSEKPSWDRFQETLPPLLGGTQDEIPVDILCPNPDPNVTALPRHHSELNTKTRTRKGSLTNNSGISCVLMKNTDHDSKSQLLETHSVLDNKIKPRKAPILTPNLMDDDTFNFQSDVLTPSTKDIFMHSISNKKNRAIKQYSQEITPKNKKAGLLDVSLRQKLHEENKKALKNSYTDASDSAARLKGSLPPVEYLEPARNIPSSVSKESTTDQLHPCPLSVTSTVISSPGEICDSRVSEPLFESLDNHVLDRFGEDLCSCLWQMMAYLCAYRGELIVEANFGRIISHGIHDAFVSNKGVSEKTYQEEKVRGLLIKTGSRVPASKFTKILTCLPAEIQYIIDIKDNQGLKYWSSSENEPSLIYELHFIDNNSPDGGRFTIEINAEKLTSKIKNSTELGNIYVHGTKRFWDFRISASGASTEDGSTAKYSEFREMISTLLFIPDNFSRPDVNIEMKDPYADRYWLEKVYVRHTEKFLSRDNQSILHVSEIESLGISSSKLPDKNSIGFHAFSYKDTDGENPPNLRSWFEVSTSSTLLNSFLEKHKTLELGEVVESTPHGPEPLSIARSLYIPACWMLERLDGVGHYNDNRFDIRRPITTTSAIKPPMPTVSYW